ncbi:MAG TPA: DUF2442 domain-containing protein [Terriglobia bacterium]|nr:DUF2442 domain-containing protein [Terriglobia bacterium]
MSTATLTEPRIVSVDVTSQAIVARLLDGRVVSVPLEWSWRLTKATPDQRKHWEIIGGGEGVHWPDVDEDISVEGMLRGVPAKRPSRAHDATPSYSGQMQITLGLDFVSADEPELLDAVRNAFPQHLRPRVYAKVLCSGMDTPLFVLGITALGWGGKRLLTPALDELGVYLQNAVRAFVGKRQQRLPGVRVDLSGENLEIEIKIDVETTALLGWAAPNERLSELRQLLVEAMKDAVVSEADRLFVAWNGQSEGWELQQVWPKDMDTTRVYYLRDDNTGTWVVKRIG